MKDELEVVCAGLNCLQVRMMETWICVWMCESVFPITNTHREFRIMIVYSAFTSHREKGMAVLSVPCGNQGIALIFNLL